MDRRDFLKKGAFFAAGTVASASVLSSLLGMTSCSGATGPKHIGLQMYSLREQMDNDAKGTIRKIAEMGYKNLETASSFQNSMVYGLPVLDFKSRVEDLGMAVTSAHVSASSFKPGEDTVAVALEEWKGILDTASTVGCKYVIQPWMAIPETIEPVKEMIDYLNQVSELAAARDLKMAFHNHSGELTQIGDDVILDYMIANSTPNMFFEFDVYWLQKGGVNPVEYINKYGKKLVALHIKDEAIIGDSGTMNFEPIFNAMYDQGINDWYVEIEKTPLPAEVCAQKSYDFLDAATYVK